MGTEAAASAIDHQDRVHGLAGLRVVDCSIMSTLISGNTTARRAHSATRCAFADAQILSAPQSRPAPDVMITRRRACSGAPAHSAFTRRNDKFSGCI